MLVTLATRMRDAEKMKALRTRKSNAFATGSCRRESVRPPTREKFVKELCRQSKRVRNELDHRLVRMAFGCSRQRDRMITARRGTHLRRRIDERLGRMQYRNNGC
jgi:hypothetical protein